MNDDEIKNVIVMLADETVKHFQLDVVLKNHLPIVTLITERVKKVGVHGFGKINQTMLDRRLDVTATEMLALAKKHNLEYSREELLLLYAYFEGANRNTVSCDETHYYMTGTIPFLRWSVSKNEFRGVLIGGGRIELTLSKDVYDIPEGSGKGASFMAFNCCYMISAPFELKKLQIVK